MCDRHWKDLNELADEKFDWNNDAFKMDHLIRGDFIKKSDDVEEIIAAAKQQAKIYDIIVKTEKWWNTIMFEFSTWKGKSSIFSGAKLNEILERLMDDQNNIAAIQNKKHVKPFIESVVVLLNLFD